MWRDNNAPAFLRVYQNRGSFKNTSELLDIRDLKSLPSGYNLYLSMYGWDILCGISKVIFEIPHKMSKPYIERYEFYTTSTF